MGDWWWREFLSHSFAFERTLPWETFVRDPTPEVVFLASFQIKKT